MSFDDTDYYVFAAAVSPNSFAEHVECLSHAGRIAKEKLKNCPILLRCGFFQPLLGCLVHGMYYGQLLSKEPNR